MISVELVALIGVLCYMIGASLMIYHNRVTKWAMMWLTFAAAVAIWIGSAYFVNMPVVGVKYHPIQKQLLADGTAIDVIVLPTPTGQPQVVNVNQQFGVSIPNDGKKYQIAQVEYAQESWGLIFGRRAKYKVVVEKH